MSLLVSAINSLAQVRFNIDTAPPTEADLQQWATKVRIRIRLLAIAELLSVLAFIPSLSNLLELPIRWYPAVSPTLSLIGGLFLLFIAPLMLLNISSAKAALAPVNLETRGLLEVTLEKCTGLTALETYVAAVKTTRGLRQGEAKALIARARQLCGEDPAASPSVN